MAQGLTIALPDPIRAHGAWVYLFASIGAGALVGGAARGVEPALLVGTGFAGGFLAAGATAVAARRRTHRLVVGVALTALAWIGALALGAERDFLWVAASAALPALASVVLARRQGVLSGAALTTGIATLVLAAPAAAVAGGVGAGRALLLFGLLWPVYSWRSLRIAAHLERAADWTRAELKARGLREAGVAAVWTLAVAVGLRLMPPA